MSAPVVDRTDRDTDEPRIRHLFISPRTISRCGLATRPTPTTRIWNPGDQVCVVCAEDFRQTVGREWVPPC